MSKVTLDGTVISKAAKFHFQLCYTKDRPFVKQRWSSSPSSPTLVILCFQLALSGRICGMHLPDVVERTRFRKHEEQMGKKHENLQHICYHVVFKHLRGSLVTWILPHLSASKNDLERIWIIDPLSLMWAVFQMIVCPGARNRRKESSSD